MKTQIIFLLLFTKLIAQTINWTDITNTTTLPNGVKLFKGERTSPALKAWYLDVDLNQKNIAIKPYLNPIGKEGIVAFSQRFNAFASINGGYFNTSGTDSYSALVNPDNVLAKNIASVVRDGKTYTLTRSFFGIKETRELSIDWIYHFGNRVIDIYKFSNPTQNIQGTPAPPPNPTNGERYYELLAGIGGGPTLVKNGAVRITYNEEVFWGSGVGLTNRDPRTAVGYTNSNHVIMLVADGRQTASEGLSLPELAQVMIDLGCKEAMNLDGGGSTQMAVGNTLINRPEGGTYQRPLTQILAVVTSDSLPLLPPIYFNKKIDTGDANCVLFGNWTSSIVSGYWGNTPAQITNIGTGNSYAKFSLELPKQGNYEISAWWVASSDRAKDVPFIVKHSNGIDTIRVDQSINGSKWNRIGTFTFNGNSNDEVIISNFATSGVYVVADAIRILSFDSTLTSINERKEIRLNKSSTLYQNYPNPLNPTTTISFNLNTDGVVSLKIFDTLGREIMKLLDNEFINAGCHSFNFNNLNLTNGVYFYYLETKNHREAKKMIVVK
ncbi:MAG: phosphodiester glycosidase family protein [Ignavibacteria bacterium]|nr:phosphodiester glycosidase family protein [Ignavibacteria bacterium]